MVALAAATWIAGTYAQRLLLERASLRLDPFGLSTFAADNAVAARGPAGATILIGDSRIAMWNPKPQRTARSVHWRGIGGQSTTQVLGRFEQDVLGLRPSAVVISAGVNDLVAAHLLGGEQDVEAKVVANLSRMAGLARARNISPFVATVIRPHRPTLLKRWNWPSDIYAQTERVNAAIKASSKGRYCVVDFDGALSHAAGQPLPAEFASDELHLTASAYAVLDTLLDSALSQGCHDI